VAAARRPHRKTRPDKTGARNRTAKPRLLKAFPGHSGHRRVERELEVQRARLKGIIDSSLDAIITIDEMQRVVEFNKAAESMFRCSAAETMGQPLDRFVPKRFRAANRGLIKAFAHAKERSGKPGRLNLMVGLRTSGEEFPFEGSISQVTAGKRKLMTIVLRDVTERKLAERALREEEERFGAFLDHAPNLAFLKGTDGRYLYVNRRFEEVFQFEQGTVLGRKDVDLFPREHPDQFQMNDRRVQESGQAEEFEETARHSDGLHTSIVVKFPLRDTSGRIYAIGGIVTDITDRKQAEEELQLSQEELRRHQKQLQDLTLKLLAAQETERQRIARELHDDFSQRLAALVLDVASLEQHTAVLPESNSKPLESIREQLEQLADDVHNMAYQLHPSVLVHAGLQPAINDHIHNVAAKAGLRVLFKAKDVPSSLPIEQSTCLFRIVQESLQNILKHANAHEAMIRLSGSSKGIGVSVTDNGKGFDIDDKNGRQGGLGLISMHERMRLLGGLLRVHSRPAGGTKVCAWIPFKEGNA
jgi:PAS domain S-box-containing protein